MTDQNIIPHKEKVERINNFKALAVHYQQCTIELAKELREIFDSHDISTIDFSMQISGRVRGDLKITYDIGESYSGSVKGSRIANALEEMLRRKGWQATNDPKELSYNPSSDDDDGGIFF